MITTRIYIYAGPGAGKSTLAADIFQAGKRCGKSIELVREYAKDLVWEGRPLDQIELWAEQRRRENVLTGKVDYLVTDSPWPIGQVYGAAYGAPVAITAAQVDMALAERRDARNAYVDVLVRATKPYVQAGRNETAEKARALDVSMFTLAQQLAEASPAGGLPMIVTSDYTGAEFWSDLALAVAS